MIAAPLAPDLSNRRGPEEAAGPRPWSARAIGLVGALLIGAGVVGFATWAIFLSPLGFTRYPLSERDRTFTIRRPGTYVVYFEFPDESQAALPPALDISVASLTGQHVDITTIGQPGQKGAPGAYDIWKYEGRAVALITSHQAGTFVVSITPTPATQVDTSQERIVTQGTIALGRAWSRTWLASWGGVTLLVVVPIVAGISVLVVAWRRRARPALDEPADDELVLVTIGAAAGPFDPPGASGAAWDPASGPPSEPPPGPPPGPPPAPLPPPAGADGMSGSPQ